MFARRTSLIVSAGTLVLTLLIAVPVGGIAGYYGGWLDDLLLRVLDVFLVIPALFLVIMVVAVLGSQLLYLGFIGLGDPRIVSWGSMLRNAQQMLAFSWWMAIFPAIFVSATILCFQQIGDGLIEAISSRPQAK